MVSNKIDTIKILHTIRFLSSLYFYHQVVTLYLQTRGLNYVQINSFLSGCFEAMLFDSLKANNQEREIQKVAGLNGSFALAATMMGSVIGGFLTADLQLSGFIKTIILIGHFCIWRNAYSKTNILGLFKSTY